MKQKKRGRIEQLAPQEEREKWGRERPEVNREHRQFTRDYERAEKNMRRAERKGHPALRLALRQSREDSEDMWETPAGPVYEG